MEDKIKEKKITGPGGIGTPRPGTAETTEQVSAGSLSSGCKATACEVDPRPCSQRTTGMIKPNINMSKVKMNKKLTGAGEFGGPRPGVEGIRRVPSSSLSDDRRGEQAGDQACSSAWTTGSRGGQSGESVAETYYSDASSWGGSSQPRKEKANKRRRARSSTTPSGSDVMEYTDNESDGRRSNSRLQALPPPKTSKRLPTDEERLAEMRHEPSANLAANILEAAVSIATNGINC